MSAHRRMAAFTLTEVLVVAAAMALLLAILLPSLARARLHMARLSCASNLKTFGEALNYYRINQGRYPLPGDLKPLQRPHDYPGRCIGPTRCRVNPCGDRWSLHSLGDVAQLLVSAYLVRPDPLFCPISLQRDRHASRPYERQLNGYLNPIWKTTGNTSYIYLAGIRMPFTDDGGRPTFQPATESPDRAVNRASPRTVLAGDRTVEFKPKVKSVPGSNHSREGGWFCYTTGDVLWRDWALLSPHPAVNTYIWYWPRLSGPRD